MSSHCVFVIIFNLCACLLITNAFNLSPRPNIIFKLPNVNQKQSAYFGISVILRDSSVYVGAPRAQSTLQSQLSIDEPGVIFKCVLKTGRCTPFNFDTKGDIAAEPNDYTWDSENKEHQWLGASMDGGPHEKDRMVVCAPRFFANSTSPEGYLMHGICYVAANTIGDQPSEVRKISPLRLKRDQTREINGMYYFYNAYAQMGFSVHNVESKDEIIFGAPGLATWKGSMVRYREKDYKDQDVSRSRRDTHRSIRKRELKEYISDVLQPELWAQPNDTYFGYSVTSGYFHGPNSTKLLYLASAPQSDAKDGEVYLFSIEPTRYSTLTITKQYVFEGTQFGEYFGYSLLAEDINGDNFTDVIVSAPNYYITNSYENGAVYVFLNLGQVSFSQPIKVTTGKLTRERFGTTVTKLGDINLDGYNDIAVSAPFSGSGTVYIYLGGPNGLRLKPSQIIQSPNPFSAVNQPMFGFGLSKGVDFDSNGYNDLAIGEPGLDATYVYRSYPVVKIIGTIDSPSRQIQIDQNKVQIKICWSLQTRSKNVTAQEVNFSVKFDPILKRLQVPTTDTTFKAVAKAQTQCKIYDATVKVSLRDIFRPVEIDLYYSLANSIQNVNAFCETCAVADPEDPKFVSQKIAFMTGCKNETCVANLKLKSLGIKSPFILGSKDNIIVKYIIRNEGENAYLPQINITSSNNMPFTRIPSACSLLRVATLQCNLNDYRPLGNMQTASIEISFDSSNLQGTKAVIRAQVFSVGNESNPIDNVVEDVILFTEFSQVEVSGEPLTPSISLEDGLGFKKIKNQAEIRNLGPSLVKQMEVTLQIPLAYIIPKSHIELPLIDFNNITLVAQYNNRNLDITYKQNGSILIPTLTARSAATQVDSSKSPKPITANKDHTLKSISSQDYDSIAKRPVDTEIAKELSGTVPINRTVFFNCYENSDVKCVEAIFTVTHFQREASINISFSYTLDLDIVNKILIPEKDFFVVTTLVELSRLDDLKGTTIQMSGGFPNNTISKHHLYSTPIWVYIVSAIGGLLILLGITYGMHKLGFFKRDKLQELQAAKHETQPLNQEASET
ncbi:unnamed protein product [Hermetia illucens]|uniref:Integrin alpha second immunoglobulin-like domain-containing protein n=1 Tax=Hermetia illucens TaxID=343691 RepID=A0A7R8V4A7_HERIL|nr:integrin alpha-PS3-like isoform X3 [Hermetia illucens]CAD7092606.1 unnamed protein product [Hermetia illucens]